MRSWPLAPHHDLTGAGSRLDAAAADYQLNDSSGGNVLSILPPGEHGLYNAADIAAYQANGTRPAGARATSSPQYANLLYNAAGLTDAQLPTYFNDELFGIPRGQITRTETPSTTVPVVIYRDTHEVPHIYAQDRVSLAYGAGYAAAEDRLFMMDVLRHYGAGNLSAFLGPSCADEQMDHDSLLLGGYTQAQKQAQIDALPTQYGALGQELKDFATSYVAGINAYIAATQTNPHTAAGRLRRRGGAATALAARPTSSTSPPWWAASSARVAATRPPTPTLLRYLQGQFGSAAGADGVHRLQAAERPRRADHDRARRSRTSRRQPSTPARWRSSTATT